MNQFWKEMSLAGMMGIVVPGILIGLGVATMKMQDVPVPTAAPVAETAPVDVVQQTMVPVLSADGTPLQMELSEYLTGVVLAEMPASFEMEALKAQAVVARTYTIRAWERSKKHEAAAVCMNPSCCQGYRSEEEYLQKGGKAEDVARIRDAVTSTENLVLTYEGELIEATYFSCSGGSTEDAVAVWGTKVPYLESVASPGEDQSKHFETQKIFSVEEFLTALGQDSSKHLKSEDIIFTYTNV